MTRRRAFDIDMREVATGTPIGSTSNNDELTPKSNSTCRYPYLYDYRTTKQQPYRFCIS